MDSLKAIVKQALAASREAKLILATHEASPDRLIALEDTYKDLGNLSLSQDDLFRQALRAIEEGLYRSSIVMAWAGFMDFLEVQLAIDGFFAVNREYPKWGIGSLDDLRDIGSEFQIVEAARKVGLCTKTGEKALKGLLTRRNEAAHPSDFYPGLNEALGYVSEVLHRIKQLQPKAAK